GRRFDVVMLDLTVPGGMGGEAALAALRAMDPDVRAIASSGYADDAIMARFRDFGFLTVIPKPFTVPELGLVLETATSALPATGTHAGHRTAAPSAPVPTSTAPAAPTGPASVLPASPATSASLSIVEREHILRVLAQLHGNKVAAARVLGVSRRTLYRRLRKHKVGTETPPAGVSPTGCVVSAPRRP
ncbi:MAG TPA: helix-turn-helix domain-containing protein, partial [Vicinamibacterales bacterium]|nr:helix-turn-helix domain-containing protein [Vicinamibacterales bacterium]